MDYAAQLTEQSRFFASVVLDADLSTPVPTCPGWSMLQLFRHVGRGDRWAAEIIRQRATTDLDPRSVPHGRPPDDSDGARAWLHNGAQLLIETAMAVDPDGTVATFHGPRPAQWWIRRRLHEATIHRADAALARGQDYQLHPNLAADGIEEWLERLSESDLATQPLQDGATIRLEATDINSQWCISGTVKGISWSHELPTGTRPDVNLTGNATNILLALLRRIGLETTDLHLNGNSATWTTWLAQTPL
jgi:uncharacterized protein (TIGR03083 family)